MANNYGAVISSSASTTPIGKFYFCDQCGSSKLRQKDISRVFVIPESQSGVKFPPPSKDMPSVRYEDIEKVIRNSRQFEDALKEFDDPSHLQVSCKVQYNLETRNIEVLRVLEGWKHKCNPKAKTKEEDDAQFYREVEKAQEEFRAKKLLKQKQQEQKQRVNPAEEVSSPPAPQVSSRPLRASRNSERSARPSESTSVTRIGHSSSFIIRESEDPSHPDDIVEATTGPVFDVNHRWTDEEGTQHDESVDLSGLESGVQQINLSEIIVRGRKPSGSQNPK